MCTDPLFWRTKLAVPLSGCTFKLSWESLKKNQGREKGRKPNPHDEQAWGDQLSCFCLELGKGCIPACRPFST